jgi:DNA-directed RNA polymerase
MDDLEKRQQALDRDALEDARERLKKAARRAPLRLLRKYWKAVAEAVQKAQKTAEEGANWPYVVPLVAIDAEKLALITLGTTLKSVGDPETARFGPSVASVLREIAQLCWYENVCDKLQSRERNLAYALARRNKNPWHARRRASRMIAEFREERWGDTDMGLQLGGALLDLAIKATGLFFKQARRKASSTIQLTPKGKEEVQKLLILDELLLVPIRRPRVLPPVPWTGPRGGGYGDDTLDLVSAHKNGPPTTPLAHGDLGIACRAVNALQETPWRIHRRLYEVMREAWASGEPEEVLPPPLPAKREARNARLEREILAARDAMERRLALARRFLDDLEIYFPWHLDWRGRAYPIPQVVNPQADDAGRALIEFARGKPLGERGARWLAVHLANLWGRDGVNHMPFDERVKWVKDHQEELLDSAAHPLEGKKFWTKAKKPWRFLASAMEWAGYVAEGPNYVSRQPVAMDGTCNVHQHLSGLGRDPVGGGYTNLVPEPKPQDIYQEVANRVAQYVGEVSRSDEDDLIAWLWDGLVDRVLVKQPTMTAPYGVTHKGLRDQIRAVIREDYPDRFQGPWSAAEYLIRPLKDALEKTLLKAVEITRWLRECAKLLGKKKQGLTWVVPTGFRVTNLYPKMEGHRVRTALITLETLRPAPGGKIDLTDAANGIVANLVHSLDAAHMMLTVCALYEKGLRDFAMVHDSYAVHAADVDLLQEVLREQFVRVHNEFTLAKLFDDMKASAPGVDLRPPPAPGSLDIAEVRRSLYLFS